jgi:CubicO group peptidase (beta-lactamase class C family)
LNTRAVVVVHRGQLIAERYGDGFTAQTPQLGWSMAKSVTNLMAGRLVQQGRIALADTRLRPEWTDQRARISLDHLLRMTSGLQWDETYALGTPITRMLYLERDMGGYAASLPTAHPPGSYQLYSSGTTNIVCQILQERSGLGADIASQLIFEPLGMSSAVLEPDAAGHPVCSSYLWATPRDWAVVGQFALQDGRWNGRQLLPSSWMSRSTTVTAVAGEEDGHAAHWWVNRRADGTLRFPAMPADTYWASGHDGQRVMVVPSADLVVVRMGFTPDDVDPGVDRLVGDLARALGG